LDAVLAVFHEYVVVEQRGELQTGDDRPGAPASNDLVFDRSGKKMLDCSVTDERVTPPPDTTIARA
jgi:hypothetical protein